MSPKLNVPAQYKETRQTYPRYTQDEIRGAGLAKPHWFALYSGGVHNEIPGAETHQYQEDSAV